ncbi:sulfite exporter TauE/SafE family protein [Thalassobacillus pellis]|uniref:sulfite exporter TauE/SafE family protein n=1 Tax=Thalassobacillus pellis TaxID=748008 RepID=UPI001EF8DDAD|nr:sulfite exporter TauE/SafE family protein [Thalassobacillus pellis]MBM7552045.1 putative membrane protein YfcA [Thalassobacillus pellis]
MDELIVFFIIILIASILQTATGFGFSIMATPFLLLLFQPREAIQINLILSLFISCILVVKLWKDVDIEVFKRILAGSVIGLPVGIIVFMAANINLLKMSISFTILSLTILLLFRFRIRPSQRRDTIAGGLSGVLTTSLGMPGPPLLLYFSGTETNKATLRATTLAFYLFIYFVSLLIQASVAGTTAVTWLYSLYALPFVSIGLVFGQVIFSKINQRLFQGLVFVLLLFTGIYLLLNSF